MSLFSSNHYTPQPAWREHICGLYYVIPYNGRLQKTYLPQVELQAHATILATTSRTVLTQTFINPSTEKGIKEARYTFPLYDGVSVVGFTCHVGDRTIVGQVKEKEKARAVFQEAVERGETAALLEQLPEASDVFTTTVGNIPPSARVIINITYLGELKHDMEVDGIRFTIPNVICPRYGNYPGDLRTTPAITAMGSSISITVDAEMAEGSFIQKMQSPSHPIAMTMGTTSFAPNADPSMTKASATLTLGTAELDTDFVLQIIAKDTGIPKAVLENHPTIPNHRALMATLVPKFALPAEKPEIVFVVDRSGSMAGSRMDLVNQALKVFLKSLPVGVKFNICSFGSSHSFLWKKSVTYSQKSLDEAVKHVQGFTANFGGTEMLYPLKATIEQRYKDMPLDVMMLTDGEIWNQQALFTYLNKSVTESKAPIRIFTLGIGNGVSHALIEGVAKAGNGFSQTVGEGEKMDTKVVRMLKGALSPHVNDYTLEVKYANSTSTSEEDDDFEIVEKVADSLKVQLDLDDKDEKRKSVGFQSKAIRAFFTNPTQKKPISLFDTSADPDKEDPPAKDETGEARYAHLPKIPAPKILQAPQNIPSLFAFNRTTVYLLLGPDAPQATPKSVVLRGTSNHGPLELEIPIQILDLPGETIHQLAAKKAISELEQGRGWLPEARTESGMLIKTKFEGRFEDMVERDAVRLGVQFQVGGKWCSFVAVESNKKNLEEKGREAQGWEWLEDEAPAKSESSAPPKYTFSESDDSLDEDEIESNLGHLSGAVERLHKMGRAMGKEVDSQNAMIDRIMCKSANVDATAEESPRRKSSATRGMARKVKLASGGPPAPQDSYSYTSPSPRTAQLQQQVDSTVSVMRSNITNVTERGERLDNLLDKSAPLAASAEGFRKGAAKKKSAGLFGGLFGSSQPSPPSHSPSSVNISLDGSIQSARSRSSGLGGMFGGFGASRSSSMASAPAPQPPMAPMVSASYTPAAYSFGASAQSSPPPGGAPGASAAFGAAPPTQQSERLQDYQSQLMLLEQQNKKRLLMARQESDTPSTASALPSPPPPTNPFGSVTPSSGATLFGSAPPPSGATLFGSAQPSSAAPGATWHRNAPAAPITPMSNNVFSSHQAAAPESSSEEISFSSPGDAAALENFDFDSFLHAGDGDEMEIDSGVEHKKASGAPERAAASAPAPSKSPEELLHHLISLQTFEGSWEWTPALISSLGLNSTLLAQEAATGVDKKQLATALVIAVFEQKLASFKGSWELVVDKARDWLDGEAGAADTLVERARKLLL